MRNSGRTPVPAESITEFAGRITKAIAVLLQTKHLYQSVSVQRVGSEPEPLVRVAIQGTWYVDDPSARARIVQSDGADYVLFYAPDVRLFCTTCDNIEPFNLVSAIDCIHQQDRWFRYECSRPVGKIGSKTVEAHSY